MCSIESFTRQSMELNTLRPKQDRRHLADDLFTCIFVNGNCCILIKFSMKYVRQGPIDNNSALVQIMAWRRSGDKPLSEPMMISLPTHICVTRPQWDNFMCTFLTKPKSRIWIYCWSSNKVHWFGTMRYICKHRKRSPFFYIKYFSDICS